MFIPQIDNIIDHLQSNPELIDLEIYNKLIAIYKEICCVKPEGDDDIRELWLDVPRGSIKEFGEFEKYKGEELIETYEQFERLWKDYYPDEKNMPFILSEAEAILRMVTGIDYIGIVPDYIFPRYCHGYFPKDDKIIDFMQLGIEEKKTIIANTYWYPLEKIAINN